MNQSETQMSITAEMSNDVGDTCLEAAAKASKPKLTDAQKARIERNRQKALLLRQSRIAVQPYPYENPSQRENKKAAGKSIDTGGGFLLEEEEEEEGTRPTVIKHQPGAILELDHTLCEECGKDYLESYLYDKFDVNVCDICRVDVEKYRLITKTDAKTKYLLKEPDFDKREPPLKFVMKKNPRDQRWGEMKLFLELQVAERALEVWGSEENIEEEREKRRTKREKLKQKKYDKKVKELRKRVRSSLVTKVSSSHEHEFSAETYDASSDMYSKTCQTCSHVMTYEKM